MAYRVILTPEAEADLRTAYRYIRRHAPHAAREWIRRARQSVKTLCRHPIRCPLAPESVSFDEPIRELLFGNGNRGTYPALFTVIGKSDTAYSARVYAPAKSRGRMSQSSSSTQAQANGPTAVCSHASSPDSYPVLSLASPKLESVFSASRAAG